MSHQNVLSFTFADTDGAAAFNDWVTGFLGRLDSEARLESTFIQTEFDREGVTKRIAFESACDLHRAVNADIAGQIAALKRSMAQCARY